MPYLFNFILLIVHTMLKIVLLLSGFIFTSCQTTYYIVRHAEKENTIEMNSDVMLSEEGRDRAQALRDSLLQKDIKRIFSTNSLRTVATAQPLSESIDVTIETYDAADTSFIDSLKQIKRGKILIVGHSNTVDNLVNGLTGLQTIAADLPDTAYGNLFIVKRKGGKYFFTQKHFGE